MLDAEQTFDLLVSDVSLPGLSGTDLARKLLAQDPMRWVVLCSGYDMGAYPSSWGPNVRTLLKPFELEELELMLSNVKQAVGSQSA